MSEIVQTIIGFSIIALCIVVAYFATPRRRDKDFSQENDN